MSGVSVFGWIADPLVGLDVVLAPESDRMVVHLQTGDFAWNMLLSFESGDATVSRCGPEVFVRKLPQGALSVLVITMSWYGMYVVLFVCHL